MFNNVSPRFLSFNGIYKVAVAVQRQRVIHTENSGFASPTLGQHISTFRGYRILFSIRNPYIMTIVLPVLHFEDLCKFSKILSLQSITA
jgi:hypothetical protein